VDFFEAWLCLEKNTFITSVMEGGLTVEDEYTPATWLGADMGSQVDHNAVWVALGDGTGGQIGLWSQEYDLEPRERKQPLRVIFFDSEGEMDGCCKAVDFRAFMRILGSFPPGKFLEDLGDVTRYVGHVENGKLWAMLDDEEPVEDAMEAARLAAGHRAFLSFLEDVWGVGPASQAEVEAWETECEAIGKDFEAFCNKFQE
jgi:hypothetical protein